MPREERWVQRLDYAFTNTGSEKYVAVHLSSGKPWWMLITFTYLDSGKRNKCPLQVSYLLIYSICDVNTTLLCFTPHLTQRAILVHYKSIQFASYMLVFCLLYFCNYLYLFLKKNYQTAKSRLCTLTRRRYSQNQTCWYTWHPVACYTFIKILLVSHHLLFHVVVHTAKSLTFIDAFPCYKTVNCLIFAGPDGILPTLVYDWPNLQRVFNNNNCIEIAI